MHARSPALRWICCALALGLLGCRTLPRSWKMSEPDARGEDACVPSAHSHIPTSEMQLTLDAQRPVIDACLASTQVPVELELSIARDGSVEQVVARDGRPLDGEGPGCVAEAIRAVRFPSPECDGPFRQAWRFAAGSDPEPLVKPGGGLSKTAIGDVIRHHWPQVRICYERRLPYLDDEERRITARFLIDAEGSVTWIALVKETFPDLEVGRCIVGAMRGWRFPRPAGGGTVMVTYPWVFRVAQ